MNTVVQLRPSQSEKPTVRGGRAKNADYRAAREYLTENEIDALLAAAGTSRNPIRDRLLILMAFRHALRVSELVVAVLTLAERGDAYAAYRQNAGNGMTGLMDGNISPSTPTEIHFLFSNDLRDRQLTLRLAS